MALNESRKTIALTISDGKIVKQVAADIPGAEARTNRSGKTVWEMKYASVSGSLRHIQFCTTPHGRELQLHIADGEDEYLLRMNIFSRYAFTLLTTLPNADLSQPITFSPWMKEYQGKKKPILFLKQNGVTLQRYYSNAHPNGLPSLTKVEMNGREMLDNYDQLAFLEKMVKEEILPELQVRETEETR